MVEPRWRRYTAHQAAAKLIEKSFPCVRDPLNYAGVLIVLAELSRRRTLVHRKPTLPDERARDAERRIDVAGIGLMAARLGLAAGAAHAMAPGVLHGAVAQRQRVLLADRLEIAQDVDRRAEEIAALGGEAGLCGPGALRGPGARRVGVGFALLLGLEGALLVDGGGVALLRGQPVVAVALALRFLQLLRDADGGRGGGGDEGDGIAHDAETSFLWPILRDGRGVYPEVFEGRPPQDEDG